MLHQELAGQPFIKKDYYRNLATKFNRTEKAFEYRMQNISYVRSITGRSWIKGLKPAKNIGARIATEIERLFAAIEGRKSEPIAHFEATVCEEIKKRKLGNPLGNRTPRTILTEISQYQRDAKVKAWLLEQATGLCENCELPAPFQGTDGLPFLEIHHIKHLADGGNDTVTNAIAL